MTPQAVALPYGCMQKTLASKENKERVLEPLTKCLGQLKPDTPNSEADQIFAVARGLISQLLFPSQLKNELERRMKESTETSDRSLINLLEKWGTTQAWKGICEVWASLFGLRPWVSLYYKTLRCV